MSNRRRREILRLYVTVALSSEAIAGAFGVGKPAPRGTQVILGHFTEYDGVTTAPICGIADENTPIPDGLLGGSAVFMAQALRELAELHDNYPGLPQVYVDCLDMRQSFGCWMAMPGTIEMLVPSPNSKEQIPALKTKPVERTIRAKAADLKKKRVRYHFRELPVMATETKLLRLGGPTETLSALSQIWMKELAAAWRKEGCVLAFNEAKAIEAVTESHKGVAKGLAEIVLDMWIGMGLFTERDGWLIPASTLLGCAANHKVADGQWEVAKTYADTEIIVEDE